MIRTMSGWLHQSGYPVLLVRVAREAASGRARALELQQERFLPWVSDSEPAAICAPPDCNPPEKCAALLCSALRHTS